MMHVLKENFAWSLLFEFFVQACTIYSAPLSVDRRFNLLRIDFTLNEVLSTVS
jgi:hypothetical protein